MGKSGTQGLIFNCISAHIANDTRNFLTKFLPLTCSWYQKAAERWDHLHICQWLKQAEKI